MKNRRLQLNCLLLLAALLSTLVIPCRAMGSPAFAQVADMPAFLSWYREGGGECAVTGELVVRDDLVLDGAAFTGVNLLADPIRVAAGGSLTIRNPGFCLSGSPQVSLLIRV